MSKDFKKKPIFINDESSNDSSSNKTLKGNSSEDSDNDAAFNFSLESNKSFSGASSRSNSSCSSRSNSSCSSRSNSSCSSNGSKKIRAVRKRSKWWNYFTKVENCKLDQQRSMCKICSMEIASSGNTKNFASHFKTHHKTEYEKIEGNLIDA